MLFSMSHEFVTVDCYKCGVMFAVDKQLDAAWRRDKTTFHCPNGHGQSYSKSTAEILQEKIAEKDRRITDLNARVAELENPPKKRRTKTK